MRSAQCSECRPCLPHGRPSRTCLSSDDMGPGGSLPWLSPWRISLGRSEGFWGSSSANLVPITREPAVPPTTSASGGAVLPSSLAWMASTISCRVGKGVEGSNAGGEMRAQERGAHRHECTPAQLSCLGRLGLDCLDHLDWV